MSWMNDFHRFKPLTGSVLRDRQAHKVFHPYCQMGVGGLEISGERCTSITSLLQDGSNHLVPNPSRLGEPRGEVGLDLFEAVAVRVKVAKGDTVRPALCSRHGSDCCVRDERGGYGASVA